jgi:hypothetical protein
MNHGYFPVAKINMVLTALRVLPGELARQSKYVPNYAVSPSFLVGSTAKRGI